MRVPQLGDANFQMDFTAFCNAMKQNIERLMSVQYTKGEPGNSVYASTAHVGYSPLGKLTNMSAGILGAIFGVEFNTSMNLDAVNDVIAGTEADIMVDNDYFTDGGVAPSIIVDGVTYEAIPALMDDLNGFDIEVNVDDVTGVAYLANPYIFIDGRIAGLNKMVRNHSKDEEIYKTFHDFSIAIYGKGECDIIAHPEQDPEDPATWEWEFVAVPMVPKLYFDDVINEFCWDVNGQQTGITAQGIKGDDGTSPNMILAIGSKTGSIITFEKIQVIDEEGLIKWATKDENGIWGYFNSSSEYIEIEQPKTGDFVLAFYPAAGHATGDAYECAFVGKTYIGSTGAYTYIGFDEDGRCDIFESIKLHDHWELMMDINSYTTGAPRGYILPAEPGQSPTNPSTKPDKVHMTYSEKGNQDSEGFAKLHSAPVLRGGSPDPTQMSQSENPQADHIGDWQVDYNMDVKGNACVQGSTTAQGNVTVQGTTVLNNDIIARRRATVQGDLEVQGQILGSDFQVTGKPFPISIKNPLPYLACVSRFTDVSYYVDRDVPTELLNNTYRYRDIKYNLNFTAKLEVTIGALSAMYDTDMDAAHKALQGYTDDTWGNQNGSQGVQNNKNYCYGFNHTNDEEFHNSGMKSKLYNAVKYIIPINITKTVTIPVYNRSQQVNVGDYLFDFNGLIRDTVPIDAPSNTPHIDDKHICIGCNTLSETNFNKMSYRGYIVSTWYDGLIGNVGYGNCVINKDVDVDGHILEYGTIPQTEHYYIDNVVNPSLKFGGVQGIVAKLDTSSTDGALKSKYSINGKLYYPPMDIDINYYLDVFARIFEYMSFTKRNATDTDRIHGDPVPPGGKVVDKVYDNIMFGVTPVGCLMYADSNTNKKYMASIWNGINTDNYVPQNVSSIKSIMKKGTYAGFVIASQPVCLTGKHVLNPLVSDKFIDNEYNGLSVGTIAYGTDLSTDNIVSVFNAPNTSSSTQFGVTTQGVRSPEITANFFDLTPRIRIVENNIKVCPNNINDGAWQQDSNSKIYWQSANEVPIVVIPFEGKVACWDASSNKGAVKLGVGNMKYGEDDTIGSMALHGMLIYPYTPAVISLDDGDMKPQKDRYEDAIMASGYTQGTILVNTGRMLGISDGNVCGVNYGIIQNSSVLPPVEEVINSIHDVPEEDEPLAPIIDPGE